MAPGTVKAVSDALVEVDVAEVGEVDPRWELESFARSLLAKSPATARAYASDLAAFARWAERGGQGRSGPTLFLPRISTGRSRK